MQENRKNERFSTSAQVIISDITGTENRLKDINIIGCCVECSKNIDIKPGSQHFIDIMPEKASKIDMFQLSVECKWVRQINNLTLIGFFILASPKGGQFQNYVDYLAYNRNKGVNG